MPRGGARGLYGRGHKGGCGGGVGAVLLAQIWKRNLRGLKRIVEARWLREQDQATLHDLAAEFGVSAERIRQIEHKAMQKMRGVIGATAA